MLLPGFRLADFWSQVQHSYQQAILACANQWAIYLHVLFEDSEEATLVCKGASFLCEICGVMCVLTSTNDFLLLQLFEVLLQNTFRVFLPTAEMPVWTQSWGCMWKTGKWLIQGMDDLELNLCPARHFFRSQKKKKPQGARSGKKARWGEVSMFSSMRYSCMSLHLWAGALSWKSLIPCMPVFCQTLLYKQLTSTSTDSL